MTIRHSFAAQVILLSAVVVVVTVVIGGGMPDRVPIHWGIDGRANGWGSKWTLLLLMPIVQAFQAGFTLVLTTFPSSRKRLQEFSETYGLIMFLVAALFALLHVVILLKAAGVEFDLMRVVLAAIFAMYIPLGNVMGKVQPNRYIGIKTPWTFASERVWHASHRAAGRLWFVGGVLGALAALAGISSPILLTFLTAISLAPIGQSYLISRRLEGG